MKLNQQKTSKFVQIPPDILKSVARGIETLPTLYHHPNPLLRIFFWSRLRYVYKLIKKQFAGRQAGSCLDFGGGSGILLPTLCSVFDEVNIVDLHLEEAIDIAKIYKLRDVNFIQGDALKTLQGRKPVECVIAADVLEHFKNLGDAVTAIKGIIQEDGILITSLPTENWLYVALRKVFRVQKPADHYYNSKEVESHLKSEGFVRLKRYVVPFNLKITPLFSVSAWRRT